MHSSMAGVIGNVTSDDRNLQCPDEKCDYLMETLKQVIEEECKEGKFQDRLLLEKYISPNYMGLFLNELQSQPLRDIGYSFLQKVCDVGMYTY